MTSDLSIFDVVVLWDKVMDAEAREDLIKNHWICDREDRSNKSKITITKSMHAENMNSTSLTRLHEAMILSPRTMYFQKKLIKLEREIESAWNKLRRSHDKRWLTKLDILPACVSVENHDREYDRLSFTVKHILRATYNPSSKKFEPLQIFGVYHTETGI